MAIEIIKQKIIKKGAEANLYVGKWFNRKVLFKHRVSKNYRVKELDELIRKKRTINEARALIKVKNYGINSPVVYEIDVENSTIIMGFIEGKKLKEILEELGDSDKIKYFEILGNYVALLHLNGHIHGDITTSNIIIASDNQIYLIDFGLHDYSDTIEDKSVDIHLLKRVLLSTHGEFFKICFNAFLTGYRKTYKIHPEISDNECDLIIKNIRVIEARGRYIKKEDRL